MAGISELRATMITWVLGKIFCSIAFFMVLLAGGYETPVFAASRGILVSPDTGEGIGTVWGVFIGVSEYKNTTLNLAYADKDAKALHQFFTEHFQDSIHPDHFHVLTNQEAQRGKILRALGEVLRLAQPEDLVILSLAMHGLLDPSGEDLFFLTHEADPNFPEDNGISRHDLLRQISKSKARKIVLFLDACHTGAFGSSSSLVAMRAANAADVNRLLTAMGKAQTGVAVFSSSSAAERSQEGEKFCGGHGAFTCGLLTGLRGGADFNRNGLIEIRELFDFTYRTVKTSTEGFQNPSIEGRYDNGLPLAFAPGGSATSLTQEMADPKGIPASDRELVQLQAELQALQEQMAREKSDRDEEAPGSGLIAKAPAYSAPQAFAPKILGGDGAPMVFIPEGHFTMGSKDFRNERPVHQVFLDNFYIDQHEVTVSQYAEFIKKSGAEPPGYWIDLNLHEVSQHPAVRANWDEATAYCESVGKRLPTEAEWEKAARGADERLYPWGEQDPIQILANFDKCCDHQAYSVLTSVGEKAEGQSPYGLDDMAGNVWEWTADWYDTSYYQRSPDKNPEGPPVGELKAIRGGSWSNKAVDIRTTNRHGLDPGQRHDNVGFRCAKNAS
ncbi:MAG: SUMF1/EgtB/PvdO family nonheme iron enzyme [Nitrospirales bacterium]